MSNLRDILQQKVNWTTDDLVAALNKPLSIASNGDVTVNGTYTVDELRFILTAASREVMKANAG